MEINHVGIDMIQQMEQILVDQMSKSIDKDILNNIFALGMKKNIRREKIKNIFKLP